MRMLRHRDVDNPSVKFKYARRMKLLDSNEIRQLRDVCIFEVNGVEVYRVVWLLNYVNWLPNILLFQLKVVFLYRKQIVLIMVVVSTRDFRTNQTKYLNLAKAGEHVVLKSRAGSFRIFPDDGGDTIDAPRDLMKELKNALTEVKEAIAGKRVLQSADSLLDEL